MKLDPLSRPLRSKLLTLPNKSRLRFHNLKNLRKLRQKTKRILITTLTNRQTKSLVKINNKDRLIILINGEQVQYLLLRVQQMLTTLPNLISKHFKILFSKVWKPWPAQSLKLTIVLMKCNSYKKLTVMANSMTMNLKTNMLKITLWTIKSFININLQFIEIAINIQT